MLGYLKLKSNDDELYETEYISTLKERKSFFAKLQYLICNYFYKFVIWIKYHANIITVKQIYDANIFILPFDLKVANKKTKKLQKCLKNVDKLLKKFNIDTIVVAENLKDYYKSKQLIDKKIHVLDGKE